MPIAPVVPHEFPHIAEHVVHWQVWTWRVQLANPVNHVVVAGPVVSPIEAWHYLECYALHLLHSKLVDILGHCLHRSVDRDDLLVHHCALDSAHPLVRGVVQVVFSKWIHLVEVNDSVKSLCCIHKALLECLGISNDICSGEVAIPTAIEVSM